MRGMYSNINNNDIIREISKKIKMTWTMMTRSRKRRISRERVFDWRIQ
jgi:hypothetical protein